MQTQTFRNNILLIKTFMISIFLALNLIFGIDPDRYVIQR
jgi:hypothetical protein